MTEVARLDQVDQQLAVAGDNIPAIRAIEELAEAAKRYARTHEERVAATVAKLKVARHGGRVLIDMAESGERRRRNAGTRVSSALELTDLGLSKQRSSRWQAVANLDDDDFAARIEAVVATDPDNDLAVDLMGGLKASTSVEWYTPAKYINAARDVMGGIDLDPASSALANETVQATMYFDQRMDGLTQPWVGRVWLNPPYGAGSGKFTTKLVEEQEAGRVTAAVLLLNAYGFDSEWFQPLWAFPICFTDHRILFYSPQRESGGPANGNIFVYLGTEPARFAEEFGTFGQIVRAWP